MDLGIAGRWAIVSASSQGLGRACAEALSAEGVNVVINGRDKDRLERTAAELRRSTEAEVVAVAADLTTADGRATLIAACPEPDILVTNNAGPRPGSLDEIGDDDIARALDLHFWAPIGIVRAVLGGMRPRKFGRVVNITSAMVTTPRSFMPASAGARTGLTAVMKALSFEAARDNVTINNRLPERIDSPRQIEMAHHVMERDGTSAPEPAGR